MVKSWLVFLWEWGQNMLKSLWNSFFHEINSCEPFFIKLYQLSLELEKFSAKFLNIQICYVIWTLWLCHEWITIYSWKNAAFNKKFWLDGIKYCYKDLFQYFLMKGQCWFYLIRYSNLKMVQFWKKNWKILTRKYWHQQKFCWESMVFKGYLR